MKKSEKKARRYLHRFLALIMIEALAIGIVTTQIKDGRYKVILNLLGLAFNCLAMRYFMKKKLPKVYEKYEKEGEDGII